MKTQPKKQIVKLSKGYKKTEDNAEKLKKYLKEKQTKSA
jgi:hypothetical protein